MINSTECKFRRELVQAIQSGTPVTYGAYCAGKFKCIQMPAESAAKLCVLMDLGSSMFMDTSSAIH